jgi:hypothetical protein
VVVLALLAALLAAVPAQAQEADSGPSEVTFVHGIRGFFTDVYLDDELILAGFAPERITEPLELEPGTHRIDLREADAPADADPAVTKEFEVPANGKLTAVAHWTGVEDCTITLYDETGDSVAAGSGKLIARHAAATGDVELTVDDATSEQLMPSAEVSEAVEPGDHTVAMAGLGEDGAGSKASTVPVPEGGARVVYLVGSAKNDTLGMLTQTVDDVGSGPDGVPTGNSGLAAAPERDLGPLTALALVAAAGAGALTTRRRATIGS